VSRDGVEVTAQILHVDGHVATALRPVDEDDGAGRVRELGDLTNRVDRSQGVGGVNDADDARPLAEGEAGTDTLREARTGFQGGLHKTDAFLAVHPFGTVPAAFSPDGRVGIFESNSILRAVARLGAEEKLYGADPYTSSRIDSFLDASLVFARDSQVYLLGLGRGADPDSHERMGQALDTYLGGIEQALAPAREFLVGDALTLADICFATEIALFSQESAHAERLAEAGLAPLLSAAEPRFPRALEHFDRLCRAPEFAPDLLRYLERWRHG